MKIASVAEVKARLSAYLKATRRGPVVITKNGRPVGVLLAPGDKDELERLLMAYSPKLRSILDAARQRIRQGKGVPHDEFWSGVDAEEKKRSRNGDHGKADRNRKKARQIASRHSTA